jgi:aspartate racemase
LIIEEIINEKIYENSWHHWRTWTSEFYLDVVFSCLKKNKEARPGIIITSVPLPYKIEEDLISKNVEVERYIPFLIKEAKRLENAGTDFIVMPCNSLHVFIREIRNAVSIPVLSIVEETVKFLKKNNLNKVGIVSTSATIENILPQTISNRPKWEKLFSIS